MQIHSSGGDSYSNFNKNQMNLLVEGDYELIIKCYTSGLDDKTKNLCDEFIVTHVGVAQCMIFFSCRHSLISLS